MTALPARRFKDFDWKTLKSWSRERRVIAKAEWTQGEANPASSSPPSPSRTATVKSFTRRSHCARGEMENRIKESQIDLFADRTSRITTMQSANQTGCGWVPRRLTVWWKASVVWHCNN